MTIRTDVTVDWESSPRVITVAAPSTSITIQDLHDTLRDIEDRADNLDHEYLVDSAGKESLGSGVYVGITMTLNNARLAFEARGGPSFEQCNVLGGNLVAVDSLGADMDPIETTAYTQIVRTGSSSATLLDAESGLTAGSVADAVWDESTAGHVTGGTFGEQLKTKVDAVLADTDELQTDDVPGLIGALNDLSAAEVNAEVVDVMRTDVLPDSYAVDGAQPTIAQAILAIHQYLMERAVSGTTVTVKKPDGSTAAMTFTLNDPASPTSITRAT